MKIVISLSSLSDLRNKATIQSMVRKMASDVKFLESRMLSQPENKAENKKRLADYKIKAKIAINKKCISFGLPQKYKISLPESTTAVTAAVVNSTYKLFQISGAPHPAEIDYSKHIVCKIPNASLGTASNSLAGISMTSILSRPFKGSKASLVAAMSEKGIPDWFLSLAENEPRLASMFSKSSSNKLKAEILKSLDEYADLTGGVVDKVARRRAFKKSFHEKIKAAVHLLFAIYILADKCKQASFAPNRDFAKKLMALYASVILAILSAKDKNSTTVRGPSRVVPSPLGGGRLAVKYGAPATKVLMPTALETFLHVLNGSAVQNFLKLQGLTAKIRTASTSMKDVHALNELNVLMHEDTAKFRADLNGGKLTAVEPDSPIDTYEDLLALTPQHRAWLMINNSAWLMQFLTKLGKVDSYFGGTRTSEIKALVKYLSNSYEFYSSADTSLQNALTKEFNYTPSFEIVLKSKQHKKRITAYDVQQIVDYGYLNKTDVAALFPAFDRGARLYISAQLIANSTAAAKLGVFGGGKVKQKHAEANNLGGSKFSERLSDVAPTQVSTVLPPEIVEAALKAETLPELKESIAAEWKANKIGQRKFVVGPRRRPTKEEVDLLLSSIAGKHRIRAFKILGVHDVENPSATPKRGVSVVESMWHGTDYSAASCIALAGFNLDSSLEKTARSMGSVVYFAPNADKSMQYLGSGFGFHSGTGILFHGKGYVEGAPARTCPDRPKTYAWTHTSRYLTEEIGLTHANTQFAPDLAFAVSIVNIFDKSEAVIKKEGVHVIDKPNASASKFKISKGTLK